MKSAAKQRPQKPSVLALIGGGLGAAVGLGVGRYAGLALLIPAGVAFVVGWLLALAVPARNRPVIPASAVQAGHGLWMLVGMIYLSRFDLTLIDFVILVAGAVWLAFRPSVVPVAVLTFYQLVGLLANAVAFAEATRNTDLHKALLVHLVLRVTAVALMVFGLIEFGKRKRLADEQGAPGQAGDTSEPGDDLEVVSASPEEGLPVVVPGIKRKK
jgi:hypothetical protein